MLTHNKLCTVIFFKIIMTNTLTLDEARRNNVKNYLEEHKDVYKSLTEFAKHLGMYVSNLSPILNGEKRFTDKLAETMEERLNLPKGSLSALSKSSSILIPFCKFNSKYKDKNGVLTRMGEFIELNSETIRPEHRSNKALFALKPNVNIGRDAMVKSVNSEKILIFDKDGTQLIKEKIYLILFYENLFLRRCKIEENSIIFDSDKPEIYSKIIYSGQDVVILGRLLYSAYLESY